MRKKIFTFLLALVAGIGSSWAQNPSGTCGTDLTWEFNPSTGVLAISGTGTTMTSNEWVYGVWKDQVTSVTFPESLTSIEVMSAFQGVGMSTITLPENLTVLGYAAFYQCGALTSIEIPAGVSTIQGSTFWQCSSLATVILPASITSIYDYAFADCPELTSFYSYAETPPTCASQVFWDMQESKALNLSAVTLYVPYSSIANYEAANGWKDFGTIAAIPGTEPAPAPSGSCGPNLTWEFNPSTGALTISGTGAMTSAPWGTYKEDITSLSLPDGLTAIPDEAFKGCTGLTTVTIPASVTSIGADAFHGCTSVTDVYCYPKAADLDWNDYYTDDFIEYPAIETRCHVYADECSEYIARYSQGDGVNVTFMNDLEAVAVTTNEDPQNPAVYYSTFYHGTKKYRLPNDGTEAYVADLSGSDLRLTKIAEGNDVLPNGVAVILKASSNNITLTPSDAAAVAVTATNDLQGVDAETTAPENTYVLSGTTQYGVGFYRINSENLKAHKAYVIYTGSAAPKRMRFVFNQEQVVTGIDNANADIKAEKRIENGQLFIIKNGVRYNVQGQIVR